MQQVRDRSFKEELDERIAANRFIYETEKKDALLHMKQSYEQQLRMKDEEIAQWRDFKMRQSTKMVGENLEQYCREQFEQVRHIGFPDAYFEKDNTVSATGSKGDFIFRDYDGDDEIISIMFEMKTEMESTEKKHRNEDFFKELDKDRREKNCEYAVLVTTLESNSEYYNNGIVDVSHRYAKMYVIRPQFLIPTITMLRNAARRNLTVRRELERVRNERADIVLFENNLADFQQAFEKSFEYGTQRTADAVSEIDKTISRLQKIRDALEVAQKHYRAANSKAQSLTVRKLTAGNEGLRNNE